MKISKRVQLTVLCVALLSGSLIAQQTESTGFPGDNFSLEGALALFEKAASPEDFEKKLNSEKNKVNNLDLNEDDQTDYIRVIDHMEENVHALVLQVPVSETESQDIAVIEIEKDGNESAILQIIGDPEIFGETVIVEPFTTESSGGKGGPESENTFTRVVVNVWFWPSVRFLYRPSYKVWVSPYGFRTYPRWWRPWHPLKWSLFYPIHVHHRARFRIVSTHRVVHAHRVYTPRRTTSKIVVTKTTSYRVHKTALNRKKAAAGKKATTNKMVNKKARVQTSQTTRKAAVKTKKGAAAGKRTTKTVKGKGKNGKSVSVKKTKTTKVRKKRN